MFSFILVIDMKFVFALIAFAAFVNAGVVKKNDEPITAKDIEKLVSNYFECLENMVKNREPIHYENQVAYPFHQDNFNGELHLFYENLRLGDSKEFSVTATFGENDLSIVIESMRSGITAEGKINLVGSAGGENFDKNGTYSFKWDNVGIVTTLKFLLDEKSITLDQLTLKDLALDRASISIQDVAISGIKPEELDAAILDSFNEVRQMITNKFSIYSYGIMQLINQYILKNKTPREFYDSVRDEVSTCPQ